MNPISPTRSSPTPSPYRGRLAPSPTGYLHLGHARTFWIAQARAQARHGTLILRVEDLDRHRSRPEYSQALIEDLAWFGIHWQEGPDIGGAVGPYRQSERQHFYREDFEYLRQTQRIYPCTCSRKDVLQALHAPHAGDQEPIYPGTCRPASPAATSASPPQPAPSSPLSWRFRVTDGEPVDFVDQAFGPQHFVAGHDFGDFVVWRSGSGPSYHLAVVVDDARMRVTEVVRGADLLSSTARQLLLYAALGYSPPVFYHTPLLTDSSGQRLAKRTDALTLRRLRELGYSPKQLRLAWSPPADRPLQH